MKPLSQAVAPPQHPPSRGGPTDPSHDRDLRRGIIHTQVSRRLAGALVAAFLLVIYGVPAAQAILEQVKDADSVLPELFRRAPTREHLKRFEEDLEKASYAKEWVQPRVQLALSRLAAGNKRAVVGRRGWLYYAPGVMSVAGPGFLDPATHQDRIRAAAEAGDPPLHPDPRPAIVQLHQDLLQRGIRLVLFPVPDKAALQPAELHGRVHSVPGANRDHARFLEAMRAAGVLVFDPTPARFTPTEPPRYLVQDTHWTPQWMETVARQLARFVRDQVPLPARAPARQWRPVPERVERVGDIVDMLKLPEEQTLFRPQAMTIRPVRDPANQLWEPNPEADVLLLGDSFTNVFSAEAMGWGAGAGLAPHLALALGRDVDVIAQNDSGAFATRKLLSEALGAGEDRLAGKNVVIWQFAARELAVGDWRTFSYAVKPR